MKTLASADIAAFRRTYLLAVLTRLALGLMSFAGATMLLTPVLGGDRWQLGAGLLGGAMAAYLGLSWRAARLSREAQAVTDLMARGESESAEKLLTRSLRRFSLFPRQQVVDLYHLAVLRQGQSRYAEAAELAGAVLQTQQMGRVAVLRLASWQRGWGRGAAGGGGRQAALVVASSVVRLESLLNLGQYAAAYELMLRLTGIPLGVADRVRLLSSRLRYEVAVGAFDHALASLPWKLKLIDLMPPVPYATANLLLAYAARKTGREPLGRWLVARVMASLPEDVPAGEAGCPEIPPELRDWWAAELERVLPPEQGLPEAGGPDDRPVPPSPVDGNR